MEFIASIEFDLKQLSWDITDILKRLPSHPIWTAFDKPAVAERIKAKMLSEALKIQNSIEMLFQLIEEDAAKLI